MYIISAKRQEILAAKTVHDVFLAFKDSSSIDKNRNSYDPNEVIQKIYLIIDEFFITDGQQKQVVKDIKNSSVIGGTTGGSGSIVEVS